MPYPLKNSSFNPNYLQYNGSSFINTLSIPKYDISQHQKDNVPDPFDLIDGISGDILDSEFGAIKISNTMLTNDLVGIEMEKFKFAVVKQNSKVLDLKDNKLTENDEERIQFYKYFSIYQSQTNSSSYPKDLDLYELKKIVYELGGFDAVTMKKLWDIVASKLQDDKIPTKKFTSNFLQKIYFDIVLKFSIWVSQQTNIEHEEEEENDINENNKRPLYSKSSDNKKKKKKKKQRSLNIAIITHSNPIALRTRNELEFKGYPSNFATYANPDVEDDEVLHDILWEWQGSDVGIIDRVYPRDEVEIENINLKSLLEKNQKEVTLDDIAMFLKCSKEYHALVSHSLPSKLYKSGFDKKGKSPWNLHNIGLNSQNLLTNLTSFQTSSLTKFHIDQSFGVHNWNLQDSMTYSIDYLHATTVGRSKKLWFFIAPKDREKYETLLRELTNEIPQLQIKPELNEDIEENILSKEATKSLISFKYTKTNYRSTVFLSPDTLQNYGITVHHTVQSEGEYVFLMPNTYSFSISLGCGPTVSESTNLITASWVGKWSFEGENYMSKHGILPAFSIFELIGNLVESRSSRNTGDWLRDIRLVSPVIKRFIDKEKNVRRYLRRNSNGLLKIKILDSYIPFKGLELPLTDDVCDLSLSSCGMSVIVLKKLQEEEAIGLVIDADELLGFLSNSEKTNNFKINLTGYNISLYQDDKSFTHLVELYDNLDFLENWYETFVKFITSSYSSNDKESMDSLIESYRVRKLIALRPLKEYDLLNKLANDLVFGAGSAADVSKFKCSTNQVLNSKRYGLPFQEIDAWKSLLDNAVKLPYSLTKESQILQLQLIEISKFETSVFKLIEEEQKNNNNNTVLDGFKSIGSLTKAQDLYNRGQLFPIADFQALNKLKSLILKTKWIDKFEKLIQITTNYTFTSENQEQLESLEYYIRFFRQGCELFQCINNSKQIYFLEKLQEILIRGNNISNDIESILMKDIDQDSESEKIEIIQEISKLYQESKFIPVRDGLRKALVKFEMFLKDL